MAQGGGHRATTSVGALLSGFGGARPVSREVPVAVKQKPKNNALGGQMNVNLSDWGDLGAMMGEEPADDNFKPKGKKDNANYTPLGERNQSNKMNQDNSESFGGMKRNFDDGNNKVEDKKPRQDEDYSQREMNNWADIKEFDDDHDDEWFKEEEKRMAQQYGGNFIRVKYIQAGRVGYYCELCYAEMNAKISLEAHCSGMKHLKKKDLWEKANKNGGSDSRPDEVGLGRGDNRNEGPKGRGRGSGSEPRGRGRGRGGPSDYDREPYPRDPYDRAPLGRGRSDSSGRDDPYGRGRGDPYGRGREDPYGRDRETPYGRDREDPYGRGREDPYARDRDDPYARGGRDDPYRRDDPYLRDPYARGGDPYARDRRDDPYGRGRDDPYLDRRDERDRFGGPPDAHYPSRPKTPPPPSVQQEKLAGGPTGTLLQKLADCCVKNEDDAELATNVITSLVKSLKEYNTKNGETNIAALLTEAELKMNTVKALRVSLKVLSGGQTQLSNELPKTPLPPSMSASSAPYPGYDRSSAPPPDIRRSTVSPQDYPQGYGYAQGGYGYGR